MTFPLDGFFRTSDITLATRVVRPASAATEGRDVTEGVSTPTEPSKPVSIRRTR